MRACLIGFVLLAFGASPAPARGKERAKTFQPPRVLSTVDANYPATSVQGGSVVLEVAIAPTGAVQDVHVLQGAKGFTQEAIQTVKKWQFAPAKFEGKPVAASIPVAFSFSQPIVWWSRRKK